MRFSPQNFNNLLNKRAQRFLFSKGYACPCLNPNSGQALYNCAHCSGKGRVWGVAVGGSAAVVGRDVVKKRVDFGTWDAGDIMLSIPSDSPIYAMGQFDRLVAVDRSEPFSINFVAGVNEVMRFIPVSIDRVFWLDSVTNNFVEGDIPIINADGTLTWGTICPPAKTTYSLTGRRRPEYYCYNENPLDRPHQQGSALPRVVSARRFDLFGN